MLPGVSGAALLGAGRSKPPEFISASVGSATSSSTLTVDKPAGVESGMLMLAFGFSSFTGLLGTLPGWTLVYDGTGSGNIGLAIYSKIAGESEPSNYSWADGSQARTCHILAYQGGRGLIDVVGAKTEATSSTLTTAGSITPTRPGVLVSAFCGKSTGRSVSSPPAGMSQRTFDNSNLCCATYDLSPSPKGATGDKTLTWSGGGIQNAGISLQIR